MLSTPITSALTPALLAMPRRSPTLLADIHVGIILVVLMPLWAMSFSSVLKTDMSTMPNRVVNIFQSCSIRQVFGVIIQGITIQVTNLLTVWARPMKSQCNKPMQKSVTILYLDTKVLRTALWSIKTKGKLLPRRPSTPTWPNNSRPLPVYEVSLKSRDGDHAVVHGHHHILPSP